MSVFNPIFPGFAWAQAFDLPHGTVQPGDGFRAEFRGNIDDPTPRVSVSNTVGGIEIEDDRLFVRLTDEETLLLPIGTVVTGFVLKRNGVELPLGQIVKVPVARYPTRPVA